MQSTKKRQPKPKTEVTYKVFGRQTPHGPAVSRRGYGTVAKTLEQLMPQLLDAFGDYEGSPRDGVHRFMNPVDGISTLVFWGWDARSLID